MLDSGTTSPPDAQEVLQRDEYQPEAFYQVVGQLGSFGGFRKRGSAILLRSPACDSPDPGDLGI